MKHERRLLHRTTVKQSTPAPLRHTNLTCHGESTKSHGRLEDKSGGRLSKPRAGRNLGARMTLVTVAKLGMYAKNQYAGQGKTIAVIKLG